MKNLPRDVHPPGLHHHDLDDDMFRLINVQPGNPEDMLDITIVLFSFLSIDEDEDCKTYVPVSYRWKPLQERVPARISGEIVMIPRDLDRLMRKARWPEGSETMRTMWIDQLCINQDDDNDKAQQVPLMRNIYERAASTIVWLGDEGIEDCELAFILMRKWSDLTDHRYSKVDTIPLEEMLGPPTEENLRSFRALHSLMSLDYWDRTWVLQEATSDKNTAVWYGDVQEEGYPLNLIFYARNLVMQFVAGNAPSVYGLKQTPSAKVGRLELFRSLRNDGLAHSLLEILGLIRRTDCSDPRDKVFSVLPFAANVGDYLSDRFLKPDYKRSAIEVYVDVARWYICKEQNLDVLGYCACRSPTEAFDLPSWVPNWITSSFLAPFPKVLDRTIDPSKRQPVYSACGPFSHTSQLVFPPLEGWKTNTLFVSGLRIATVRHVLQPVSELFMNLEVEKRWQDSFDPEAPYALTEESMQEAFERTVLADREELHEERGEKVKRGCRLVWPDKSGNTTASDVMRETGNIKRLTNERLLFYAHAAMKTADPDKDDTEQATTSEDEPVDGTGLIMGLGRADVQPSDEIWALRGGSVLYILRPMASTYKINDAESQGDMPDNANLPEQLWFNGRKRPWNEPLSAKNHHFVGEAYVHGLMDGEALEYMGKDREQRPDVLKDMNREFQEILIGFGQVVLEDENGKNHVYHVSKAGGEEEEREIPDGRREVWKVF